MLALPQTRNFSLLPIHLPTNALDFLVRACLVYVRARKYLYHTWLTLYHRLKSVELDKKFSWVVLIITLASKKSVLRTCCKFSVFRKRDKNMIFLSINRVKMVQRTNIYVYDRLESINQVKCHLLSFNTTALQSNITLKFKILLNLSVETGILAVKLFRCQCRLENKTRDPRN